MKKSLLLLLITVAGFSITACKKKGCVDQYAENFNKEAQKDDGTCTYLSDKLVGVYIVQQSCMYGGNSSYTLTIGAGGNKGEVILQGLYDGTTIVKATISGTQFHFKEDKAGITYEGYGYMSSSNQVVINTEVCETFYYPCSDPESCTMTCTK